MGTILTNPEYLILDEPDIGLDPKNWRMISNKLMELKSKGAAILITGQNYNQLDEISDKIVIIHNKKCIYENSIKSFKKQMGKGEHIDLKSAFSEIIRGGVHYD